MTDMSAVYGAAQQGMTPVPNAYAQSQLQQAQAGYYGAEARRTNTQDQALQYQNQVARYQMARNLQYINDAHTMSHQQLAALYPDKVDEIKKNFDSMHAISQEQTRTSLGSAVSLAQSGHYTDAADYLDEHHKAAVEAGQDDEFSPYVTQLLRSKDPADNAAAKRMLAHTLLSTYDQKEAPANAKALGISEEPIITKGGDVATDPLMGGRSVTPLPLTPNVVTDAAGNGRVVTTDPNVYGSTPGGFSGLGVAGPGGGAELPGPDASPGVAPQESATASGLTGIIKGIESGELGDFGPDGKPLVNKTSGARYAMQVMPATAKKPGFGVKPAASDTPAEYNRVGEQLLQKHIDFYGDPLKGAAAYQAGRGNVNKAIAAAAKEGNANNWVAHLGPQGRDYVSKFATRMASLGGQGGTQVASNTPLEAPQGSPAPAGGAPVQMAANGDYMGPTPGANPVRDPGAPTTSIPLTKGADVSYHWGQAKDGETPGQEYPNKGGLEDPTTYKDVLPAVVDNAIITGQDPTVGRGAGFRSAFYPARSARLKQLGLTEQDLVPIQQRGKAIGGALQQNESMLSMLQPNLATMESYIGQIKGWHQKLVQLRVLGDSSPVVNKAKIAYVEHFGSPEQKAALQAYRAAINSGTADYVKLTTTNTGGGNTPSTDSAQAHARQFIDEEMPSSTLAGGLAQLSTEGRIKVDQVLGQNQNLMHQLRTLLPQPKGDGGTHHGGSVPQVRSLQQYNALPPGPYIDPNGVHRIKR